MARRISEVLSVIWAHPIASCFVLLFFTPPLFPIVVYFSPLLISTALCVLALIRVGPHVAATGDEAETQSKRLRVESLNGSPWEAGLSSVRERGNKKLRRSMEEMTWAEWMRGQDGWGRSPVERQLREEAFSTDSANGEYDSAWMDDTKSPVAISESFVADSETSGDRISDMAASLSSISEKSEEMSKADDGVIGERGGGQADDSCPSSLEENRQQVDQAASGRKEQHLNLEEKFGSARINTLKLETDEKETCDISKLQTIKEVEEETRNSDARSMPSEGIEILEPNVKERRVDDEEEEMGGAALIKDEANEGGARASEMKE